MLRRAHQAGLILICPQPPDPTLDIYEAVILLREALTHEPSATVGLSETLATLYVHVPTESARRRVERSLGRLWHRYTLVVDVHRPVIHTKGLPFG